MLERVSGVRESIAEDIIPAAMIGLGMTLLFLAFFEQGQIMSLFIGSAAYQNNYLHEFFHDGRHVFALPCH